MSDHYTLATNWRSHEDMVAAVNTLFARAEQRCEKGAFIYNQAICFEPVKANGQQAGLTVGGQPQPALTLWHYSSEKSEVVSKGAYQDALARIAATEINRLLSGALDGSVTLGGRPLKAADIAVLVRTGRERNNFV